MQKLKRAVNQVITLLVVVGLIAFGYWLFDGRRNASEPAAPEVQAATRTAQPTSTSQPYPPPQTPTPRVTVVPPTVTATPTRTPPPTATPPVATPNPNVPPASMMTPTAVRVSGPMYVWAFDSDLVWGSMKSSSGSDSESVILKLATGEERKASDLNISFGGPIIAGRWLPGAERSAITPIPGVTILYDYLQNRIVPITPRNPDPNDRPGENLYVHLVARDPQAKDIDIWVYDLTTQKDYPVIVRPGAQSWAKLSGRWIAYLDFAATPAEIRLHHLDTTEDFALGPSKTISGFPVAEFAIGLRYVVWIHNDGNRFFIHIYDLARKLHYLANGPINGEPREIHVSDDYLVYNNVGTRVVYDLARNSLIATLSSNQTSSMGSAFISGNRLIWYTVVPGGDLKPNGLFIAELIRAQKP